MEILSTIVKHSLQILKENSELVGLDLGLKDKDGKTGFQQCKQTITINLLKRKMPKIAGYD